jgi:hypothetical protein
MSTNFRRLKRKVTSAVSSLLYSPCDDESVGNKSITSTTDAKSSSSRALSHVTARLSKRARLYVSKRQSPDTTVIDGFRPWSLADFQHRVESFKVSSWFCKPAAVSPLVCAKSGWRNVDVDVIECVSCQRRLHYDDSNLDSRSREACAEDFARQVESTGGHESKCPWLHIQCSVAFTTLPGGAEALRAQYRDNVTSLLTFAALDASQCAPDALARDRDVLKGLPLYTDALPTAERAEAAKYAAVHGWRASDDVMRCALCALSLPVTAVPVPFDAREAHRSFCPWSSERAHEAVLAAFGLSSTTQAANAAAAAAAAEPLTTLRAVKQALRDVRVVTAK